MGWDEGTMFVQDGREWRAGGEATAVRGSGRSRRTWAVARCSRGERGEEDEGEVDNEVTKSTVNSAQNHPEQL